MGHGFKVGDYVRHDRDGYDPTPGSYIEGRVTRAGEHEVVVKVEMSTSPFFPSGHSEYVLWPSDAADGGEDFARLRRASAPFKLKRDDRVKNLRTGRVGYVFLSAVEHPGQLAVYDERQALVPSVAASALEAYEAEHPGTYDIVTEGAPW